MFFQYSCAKIQRKTPQFQVRLLCFLCQLRWFHLSDLTPFGLWPCQIWFLVQVNSNVTDWDFFYIVVLHFLDLKEKSAFFKLQICLDFRFCTVLYFSWKKSVLKVPDIFQWFFKGAHTYFLIFVTDRLFDKKMRQGMGIFQWNGNIFIISFDFANFNFSNSTERSESGWIFWL